eukprot:RCo026253
MKHSPEGNGMHLRHGEGDRGGYPSGESELHEALGVPRALPCHLNWTQRSGNRSGGPLQVAQQRGHCGGGVARGGGGHPQHACGEGVRWPSGPAMAAAGEASRTLHVAVRLSHAVSGDFLPKHIAWVGSHHVPPQLAHRLQQRSALPQLQVGQKGAEAGEGADVRRSHGEVVRGARQRPHSTLAVPTQVGQSPPSTRRAGHPSIDRREVGVLQHCTVRGVAAEVRAQVLAPHPLVDCQNEALPSPGPRAQRGLIRRKPRALLAQSDGRRQGQHQEAVQVRWGAHNLLWNVPRGTLPQAYPSQHSPVSVGQQPEQPLHSAVNGREHRRGEPYAGGVPEVQLAHHDKPAHVLREGHRQAQAGRKGVRADR